MSLRQQIVSLLSETMCSSFSSFLERLVLLEAANPQTMKEVMNLMLSIVGKAIHVENYATPDAFYNYVSLYLQYVRDYLATYQNIRRKRAQDKETYALFCASFETTTPCFELMTEQVIEYTHRLHEEVDAPVSDTIEYVHILANEPFRTLDKQLNQQLKGLTGELFFIRLTRNFQRFLCVLFHGSCRNKSRELDRIQSMYTNEQLFLYLMANHSIERYPELADIDFPDELEDRLRQYDIGMDNGIDYDVYSVCCDE